MAEEIDLSHLDKDHLEKFRKDDVHGIAAFIRQLEILTSTAPGTGANTTMVLLSRSLENPADPFAVSRPQFGRLAQNDDKEETPVNATPFIKYLTSCSGSLAKILSSQKTLFTEIDDELIKTVKDMGEAQNESLDDIKGQDFLDDWKDVGNALTPKT
ncbi:type VII secretion system-associated protein [Streptomyces sp. GC420]|uniref:type VII secretion system-associated protein n=1 Tax=Streptomyces sp. GC420 TaxID=2697568 RepID=UPI0014151CA8|nr:type VII secretion system-associated protein [Streptomyces sp. GC420]NBM18427.1 type VII secretion system-associated protein [Streptomyces sp. GC420]